MAEEAPVAQVYGLFRNLGLRHICVVDLRNRLKGSAVPMCSRALECALANSCAPRLITRKDLANIEVADAESPHHFPRGRTSFVVPGERVVEESVGGPATATPDSQAEDEGDTC